VVGLAACRQSNDPAPSASSPATESTSFSDGTYKVGEAIEASRYQLEKAISDVCTLTVVNDKGNININGDYGGNAVVEVDIPKQSQGRIEYKVKSGQPQLTFSTEDEVTSADCGTWQKV
jgi:hypothetical protein